MRRIVTAALSTLTLLVLLFSYHTSTNSRGVPAVAGAAAAAGAAPSAPGAGRSSSATGAGAGTTTAPKAGTTAGTFTGQVVDTDWGPVQVKITVSGGRITAAQAVRYPDGNDRDARINGYALPILEQSVLQKQSAQIDTVSGATVTSDGYQQSLQSAIDQAHL